MKTFLSLLLFLSTPLLADSSAAFPPNPYETQGGKRTPTFSKANAAAIYWINLIDQQQWEATWLEAADLIKDIATQEQWGAGMMATRGTLGTVTSRKVASHHIVTTLPGGISGDIMIINYTTNFSRKANQMESVHLITEGELQQWKVISYRISDNR